MTPRATGDRRGFLGMVTTGVGAGLAGCLGRGATDDRPNETELDVRDRTRHRGWLPTYAVKATNVTEDKEEANDTLEAFSAAAQREIFRAIAAPSFFVWESPHVLKDDIHHSTIGLENQRFDVGVGVTDYARLEAGWNAPVEVRAYRSDATVRLSIRNTTAEPIDLLGVGSPPLGVLAAVNPPAYTFLSHEAYGPNGRIVTTAELAYTPERAILERTDITIASGGTLEPVYSIEGTLPEDFTIIAQLPVRVHEPSLVDFIGADRAMVDLRIHGDG